MNKLVPATSLFGRCRNFEITITIMLVTVKSNGANFIQVQQVMQSSIGLQDDPSVDLLLLGCRIIPVYHFDYL